MRGFGAWIVGVGLCLAAGVARADGDMVLRKRVLLRQGPAPDVCRDPSDCEVAMSKILSGYGFLRGHVLGGGLGEFPHARASGFASMQLTAASAAMPGGELAAAQVAGVLASSGQHRMRVSLADAEGLFFCRDAETGALRLPFAGMTTTHCQPDAMLALDVHALTVEWELRRRLQIEWLSLGPSIELLANGLGYAHILRSVMLGISFDVRSRDDNAHAAYNGPSLGAGVRASLRWRSPRWELRVSARQRTVLAGGAGVLHDNGIAGELHCLHNFLVSDALLLQAGVTASVSYYQRTTSSFELWSALDRHWGGWLGLYLGWVGAAPNI